MGYCAAEYRVWIIVKPFCDFLRIGKKQLSSGLRPLYPYVVEGLIGPVMKYKRRGRCHSIKAANPTNGANLDVSASAMSKRDFSNLWL